MWPPEPFEVRPIMGGRAVLSTLSPKRDFLLRKTKEGSDLVPGLSLFGVWKGSQISQKVMGPRSTLRARAHRFSHLQTPCIRRLPRVSEHRKPPCLDRHLQSSKTTLHVDSRHSS